MRIWILPLTGDRKAVEAFPGTNVPRTHAAFSPDDKWIAYSQGERSTESDVYIEPYPPTGHREKVSSTGGQDPRWAADGRQLVYRAKDLTIMSVDLAEISGKLRPSTPAPLFPKAGVAVNFSADKRAERFLLLQRPGMAPSMAVDATPQPVTVVMNFVQSIKR